MNKTRFSGAIRALNKKGCPVESCNPGTKDEPEAHIRFAYMDGTVRKWLADLCESIIFVSKLSSDIEIYNIGCDDPFDVQKGQVIIHGSNDNDQITELLLTLGSLLDGGTPNDK